MEFKNPFKSKIEHLLSKEAEYQLYKKAADDIEANIIDKGIWTKAYALANGDEKKQKVRYIDLIVEHYKDLIKAGEELETILKTEAEKEEAEKQKEEKQRYKNDYQQEQEVAFEDDHVSVTSVPVTTDEEDMLKLMTGAGFDGAEGVELPPPPPPPPQLARINVEVRI